MSKKQSLEVRKLTNYTEQEILAIIDGLLDILAHRYKFSYYALEDIKQEGRIIAITGLEGYDESRPLQNFLYRHLKNRLSNFVRDNYVRNESPCKLCRRKTQGKTEHADGQFCEKHLAWRKRMNRKLGVHNPKALYTISDAEQLFSGEPIQQKDLADERDRLIDLISDEIPVGVRTTFLKMLEGLPVKHADREALLIEIRAALERKGIQETDLYDVLK
jgi:DNA-directed RNA polymerase specialized sigma24 family protein